MSITAESIVFLILSVITLGSAAAVVVTRNLFHAGLYLIVSLFGVAGLFALLAAPFLVGAQVLIYIGAIAILIVLAVMLTPQVTHEVRTHAAHWPLALAIAVGLFVGLLLVVSPLADELGVEKFNADFTQEHPQDVPGNSPMDSITELGKQLVDTDFYMLPFEVASVLLMAAMVGAVLLVVPRVDDSDADDSPDDVTTQLTTGPGEELTG